MRLPSWNEFKSQVIKFEKEVNEKIIKALQVAPDHPIALANKSNLLVRLDQYQEALDVANKALQVAPDHPIALANKSAALAGLDQYQEALDVANKALHVEPDNPLVRFVISHCKANLNSD